MNHQKNSERGALITKDELQKVGKRIRQLRIAKGYKNYEIFAYEKSLPRAQVGRYEKGQDLKFSSLLKVLNALDISLQDFFGKGYGDEDK
jgi:transcriptional regulator with XRE-family HTH domain